MSSAAESVDVCDQSVHIPVIAALYPTFVRTIPTDVDEVAMLAALLKHNGWQAVATISTKDPFGAGATPPEMFHMAGTLRGK